MKRNPLLWGAFAIAVFLTAPCRAEEAWTLGFERTSHLQNTDVAALALLQDGSAVTLERSLTSHNDIQYLLSRVDRFGNLMWAKYLGESTSTSAIDPVDQSLTALSDGTFILFLHVEGGFSPDCGFNVWGCRMDASGEVMWQKYFQLYDAWWGLYAFQGPSGRIFLTTGGGELDELERDTGDLLWEKYFWSDYPILEIPYVATSLKIVKEEADGSLLCVGSPPVFPIHEETPTFLIKLGAAGAIQWAVRYTSRGSDFVPMLDFIPRRDGGYWMAGWIQYQGDGAQKGVAGRLNEEGDILWQYLYDDWQDIGWHGLQVRFFGYMDTESGLLAVGDGFDGSRGGGLTAMIGPKGTPLWERLWRITPGGGTPATTSLDGLYPRQDGGAVTRAWTTPGVRGVVSFTKEYSLQESCADAFSETGPFNELSLTKGPAAVYSGPSTSYATCDTNETFRDDDRLYGAVRFCGEPYPGVLSVVKLQNPFRLKLTGWNFQKGSKVLVNGMEAPHTRYKGEVKNGNGRKKLVAGGKGLKALLPKGQPVTITVLNPDGRESVGFTYVR